MPVLRATLIQRLERQLAASLGRLELECRSWPSMNVRLARELEEWRRLVLEFPSPLSASAGAVGQLASWLDEQDWVEDSTAERWADRAMYLLELIADPGEAWDDRPEVAK